MISIRLLKSAVPAAVHQIANRCVSSDYPLPELAPFAGAAVTAVAALLPRPPVFGAYTSQQTCDETAWLAGAQRHIRCWSGRHGYGLSVAGTAELIIAPLPARGTVAGIASPHAPAVCIANRGPRPPRPGRLLTETLLGPALILALALQGTFCLQATAVVVDGRLIAFIGESGRDKSTLPSALATATSSWTPLGSEILPLACPNGFPYGLPHFPQPNPQPAAALPAQLPLAAIYLLDRSSGNSCRTAQCAPLNGREAGRLLRRHTAAARLFDRSLSARQAEFYTAVARRVPLRRLAYHDDPAWQTAVVEELKEIRPGRRVDGYWG